VVRDAVKLIQFLKQAFGAIGDLRIDIPSVMRIGHSLVMVSSVGPHDAHFHARYGEHEVTVRIDDGGVDGYFPRRALGLLLESYALHRDELRDN
jgi:hypothetical protein